MADTTFSDAASWTFAGTGTQGTSFQMANNQSPWSFAGGSGAKSPFNLGYRGSRGLPSSKFAAFDARLQQSAAGRSLRRGVLESIGYSYEGGVNRGFLGIRQSIAEIRTGVPSSFSGFTSTGKVNAAMKHFAKADAIAATGGRAGTKLASASGMAKLGGKTFLKGLPVIGTAILMYGGYQEEGMIGAAKGLAESAAIDAAIAYAGVVAYPAMGFAAIAVAGYGYYKLAEAGRAHAKGLRELEMGGSGRIIDALGSAGAATSRQRAVTALNNTHINGRMAMGNEALLLHTSFM